MYEQGVALIYQTKVLHWFSLQVDEYVEYNGKGKRL